MKIAISENLPSFCSSIPNCPSNFHKEQVAKLVHGVVFAALIGLACVLGSLVIGVSSATAVAVGGSAMITGVVILALWFGLRRAVIKDLEGISSVQIESSEKSMESPVKDVRLSSSESSYYTASEHEEQFFSYLSSSGDSFSIADQQEKPSKEEETLPQSVPSCRRSGNRYYYEITSDGVIKPVCVPIYMGEAAFRAWVATLRSNGYSVLPQ